MISGDNYFTAVHCARLAGIIQEGDDIKDVCMTGKDFRDKVGGVKKIRDRDGIEVRWEISNK